MDDETAQTILKELMKLGRDQSRMEGKIDGLIIRIDKIEDKNAQHFNDLYNKYNNHEERITILETKAGKHTWRMSDEGKYRLKVAVSLGGMASLLMAIFYGIQIGAIP